MHNLLKKEYENLLDLLNSRIENLKQKRILITGATGLIGSYLVDFLLYLNKTFDYKIEISVISRKKEKIEKRFKNQELYIIEQDLNEKLNFEKEFDYVIHLASNAHPLAFSLKPVETMKTNILGTINLLDMIKNTKAKFLYISSGEIYGSNDGEIPFKEEDLGQIDSKNVRSCYPESKRVAETLCMTYSKEYNIPSIVLRLCYIYGATITEENSRADAQFLRKAINKEDIVLKSKGTQKRTYCYVADAVSAILFTLLDKIDCDIFNVANKNSIVSVFEYAKTLSEIADVQLKFENPDEIEKTGYSKAQNSILSSEKLMNLGWKPLYDIKEGLKHTFEIKKDNLS